MGDPEDEECELVLIAGQTAADEGGDGTEQFKVGLCEGLDAGFLCCTAGG